MTASSLQWDPTQDPHPQLTEVSKILILKPSSLGDIIHAIPVLRLLRARFPSAEIAWWVESSFVDLLEGDPDLTRVVPFDRQGFRRVRGLRSLGESLAWMRAQSFDWVIDLQGLARSGMVSWIANGKFTIGVEDLREGAPAFYDARVPRPSPLTHAVDWYLEVLRTLGVPVHSHFEWLPSRADAARSVREKWNPRGSRWICVQPGARWWNKRYPLEHFEESLRQIASQHADVSFAILGGRSDAALGEHLARLNPGRSLNLAGKTTLPEMIEWIRLSKAMITNDSGPMHAAAALGKPVVALFGPTDPRRTGPYLQQDQVLKSSLPCAPCMKPRCRQLRPMECLFEIHPTRVASRLAECLE